MDEIGDMPIGLQAKLLRVLQDGNIRRVGENVEIETDVRIVCATNKDVKILRQDLYNRVNTFVVRLKPLGDRPEDAKLIIKSLEPNFPTDKIDFTLKEFPGNVRDLKAIVRRYQVLGEI